MQNQQRIMLIDDGGILRHEFPVSDNSTTPLNISNSLFSGMIVAINAISRELGGVLQIIVIGTEKLASRYVQLNEKRMILIVADTFNSRDDLLLLKTEIIARRINNIYQTHKNDISTLRNDPYTHIISHLKNDSIQGYFDKILNSQGSKFLLNILKQIPSDFIDFERMLNFLAEEIPTIDALAHPALIFVGTSKIVVPYDFNRETKIQLLKHIKDVVTPLVGVRYITALYERFSLEFDFSETT